MLAARGRLEELLTSKIFDEYEKSNPDGSRLVSKFRDQYFDSFMDALGYYLEWRQQAKNPKGFLDRLLKKWGIRQWIPEYSPATINKILENSAATLFLNDEATISMALSALLVDGKMGKQLKERAIVSINRQTLDIVLSALNCNNFIEAKAFWGSLKVFVAAL